MSGCWLAGEWRAYLDGELPPLEAQRAREHLENCAECEELLREVDGRSQRVGALMAQLDEAPEAAVAPRRAAAGGGRRAMAVVGMAAALAVAFLLLPKRAPQHGPAGAPVAQAVAKAEPVGVPAPAGHALGPERAPKRRAAPKARVEYYLPLDSEPIETGVIVRVALDDGLLADVIVDEQGKPRAVRPVQ